MKKNLFLRTFKIDQTLDNKKMTNRREPIFAVAKLRVTLCYLAIGEKFESLTYQFRVYSSTIVQFIHSVCQATCSELKDIDLKIPSIETEWGSDSIKNSRALAVPKLHRSQ